LVRQSGERKKKLWEGPGTSERLKGERTSGKGLEIGQENYKLSGQNRTE